MAENQNTQNTEPQNNGQQSTTGGQTVDVETLFAKLDEITDKKLNSVTKSILKDNGYKDDEVADLLPKYRAYKDSAKNQASERLTSLEKQNTELNKELFNIKLTKEAEKAAAKIGMKSDRVSYALKNVDLSTMAPDGKIDSAKVEEALQKVLDEIPEFKTTEENNSSTTKKKEAAETGVRKVGAKGSETNTTDAMAQFKRALGLKSED